MGQSLPYHFGPRPRSLGLAHPTDRESNAIWAQTSSEWRDALPADVYLEESLYLLTVPLAQNGGMTQWVLVDKSLPPDHRALLASCETFYKRAWVSDPQGNVTEVLAHGVASVHVNPKIRRRGYGTRLMRELAKILPTHQTQTGKAHCAASILFSDIGKGFYARVGWHAFPSFHLVFAPRPLAPDEVSTTRTIYAADLQQLCEEDKRLSRKAMGAPSPGGKTRFMVVPDHEHMLWHHSKEEFVARTLVQTEPLVKGALFGDHGQRIWVVWTHRFYEPPSATASTNTLYILRLVIESPQTCSSAGIRAVFTAAQAEAATWGLHSVKLWDPSSTVLDLVRHSGPECQVEAREEEGICCLRWYGRGSGTPDEIEWVGNEKYGWC